MNYSQSKLEFTCVPNNRVTIKSRLQSWATNFWRFSLFYGDYLASLHSKKSQRLR